MRHVQRITNDRRRDHLLAPSRQLAMHGIVRKLRRASPKSGVRAICRFAIQRAEVKSSQLAAAAAQASYCCIRQAACQAYQPMHNTQGAARSAPHVDTHVHVRSGTPVRDLRIPAPPRRLQLRLRRVSSRFVQKRRVSLPYTDESTSHANLVKSSRQRFAVRATGRAGNMPYHQAAAAVPCGVSTLMAGQTDDGAHAVCATLLARTHSHAGPDVTVSGCFGPHMRLVL
jgi:hypothetical protein